MAATGIPLQPTDGRPALRRLPVPFITTSFALDLALYAALWPLWWAMGIDQLLLPFFAAWELGRYLLRSRFRFRLNRTTLLSALLALWWIVPALWLDREYFDIFVKETATIVTQVILLFLFFNAVRTASDWWRVVLALELMAGVVALGGLIYLSGVFQGEFTSLLGRLLPAGLANQSDFFGSLAVRTLGEDTARGSVLGLRVYSVALNFSALSLTCLLLIPLTVWRIQTVPGWGRLVRALVLAGLFGCLIFSESRIAYVAFAGGVGLYLVLRLDLLRGDNKLLAAAAACLVVIISIVVISLTLNAILESLQFFLVDWRPGSWLVRLRIYQETLRLLPEHWFAGWGVPVRIPGAPNNYSAGTHSSLLGMFFQHGIVGLVLYLLIWLSIWRAVIYGMRAPGSSRAVALFWPAVAAALFSFNLREIADNWWWDQLTTYVLWLTWGLVLSGTRIVVRRDAVESTATNGETALQASPAEP
jgi:hypothetical protein